MKLRSNSSRKSQAKRPGLDLPLKRVLWGEMEYWNDGTMESSGQDKKIVVLNA
jgi:hypothetical protein